MRILLYILFLIALGYAVINILLATFLIFMVYLPIGIVMAITVVLTIATTSMFIHIYRAFFRPAGGKGKGHDRNSIHVGGFRSRYYRDWYTRNKRF